MKKITILFLTVVLMQSLSAQDDQPKERKTDRRAWFDLQIAQHIGLNQWGLDYVHDGFPNAMITELRGAFNLYMARPYVGVFIDMGLGFMPAPRMRSLDLDRMPMPRTGTAYYLRDIFSESGNTGTSAHFKMTLGLFGKIPANEKLSIMPYFGIGFLTMPQRKYEILLKEQGSNIQYQTLYVWNCKSGNEDRYDRPTN